MDTALSVSTLEQSAGLLADLGRLRSSLETAGSFEEVRDIAAHAEALRLYAKKIRAGLAVQNECAEVKIRAERRMGRELAALDKHKGGRPPDETDHGGLSVSPPTLEQIGVSPMQSHRWQTAAELPEESFRTYTAILNARGRELTSAGVYQLARSERSPEEWPDYSDKIPTEFCCPRCRFEWNGQSKSRPVLNAIARGAGVSLMTVARWFAAGRGRRQVTNRARKVGVDVANA
jgi:hypothetical protein